MLILNIQLLGGTMNKQNFSQKKYVESRNLLTWWQTNLMVFCYTNECQINAPRNNIKKHAKNLQINIAHMG